MNGQFRQEIRRYGQQWRTLQPLNTMPSQKESSSSTPARGTPGLGSEKHRVVERECYPDDEVTE
jgi:hypothetical protein